MANRTVPPTDSATGRHRREMTSTRATAASLLGNTSGIPLQLPVRVVHRPRCVECQSLSTWTMPSVAPFTSRPMLSRFCDDCGRVSSAYTDR